METTTTGGAELLARVRELRPVVEAAAPEAEAARRLPRHLVEELRGTGVFRMPMPASWGGPQMPVLDQVAVLEELSYADGAAGWCAMIGCDAGYYAHFLDEPVARAVFDDLDLITAGQTSPNGTAVRDGDGWRLSGRWSFGSGCTHADRMVGGAFLHEPDGSPAGTDDMGLPEWRTFVLPRDEVQIHDTWNTTGLIGTGSHDYSADGAWVPDEHAFQPLRPPLWGDASTALPWWFVVKVAAVPLGLARRALDELVALAPAKLAIPEFTRVADAPQVRADAARARAVLGSARAWFVEVVGDVWATCERGDAVEAAQRGDLRLAMAHASSASREAIGLCFDAAGTSAVRRGSALDRAYRDAATLAQHVTINRRIPGHVGEVLFGGSPSQPMF